MKNDRFLTAIFIGIGVIILLALGVFLLRQNTSTYIAEDNPAGIVHNYVLAIYQQDFQKAYTYLAEAEQKPDFEQFRQSFVSINLNLGDASLKINETSLQSDSATVYITIIRQSNGPFSEPYREPQTAILVKQNGQWKLTSMPYPYWNWDWFQISQPTALPAPKN
jgi:uncharacterized protein YneF (UPF0154 family)